MTRKTAINPLDNGGQGCFHASMANQTHSDGEPPETGNASVRRPEAVGEPAEALADAILRAAGSGLRHYTEFNRKRIVEAAEQELARVLSAHAHLGEG